MTTLNAKYIHSNLALKYLLKAAINNCCKDLMLEEFTINQDDDFIFTELLSFGCGMVCFSCYIWNIERILYIAENIKKANPEMLILLGGPETTYRACDLMMNCDYIDFILTGEGDVSFPHLLSVVRSEHSKGLEDVEGLYYRQGSSIRYNRGNGSLEPSMIHFPYEQDFFEKNQIVYYESSRGCPYNCSYCLSSADRDIRAFPLSRVMNELDYFIKKKVKQVKFVDRTFNWDKARSYDLFRFLMENDNGITNFHMEMRGDLISEKLLRLLTDARPGLFQFEIGVQSTNPATLVAVNRVSDLEKLYENVRKIRGCNNIHLHLDLIAGLPCEDCNSFKRSFNQVYELSPDHLQLGFLKLLPGTPIIKQIEEHGYIYRRKTPYEVISNRYMTAESLVHLKKVETVLNLYYNRVGFKNSIKYAVSLADTAFDFYDEFAHFYHLEGFQKRSHSKENLYRILYQYGIWKNKHRPGTCKELGNLILLDIREFHNVEAEKRILKEGWNV